MNQYHVYIMTNKSGTLYTGITSNLEQRVYEQQHSFIDGKFIDEEFQFHYFLNSDLDKKE